MNRFMLLASLALAVSATVGLGQDTSVNLVIVPLHAHAEVDRVARDRVAAVHARTETPAAVIEAIRAVDNPLAREAQWNAWLDSLAATARLDTAQIRALERLADHSPVLGVPHHEFPSRTVAAYPVADRARALLARDATRRRAAALADSPKALMRALEAPPGTHDFADGLLALERASARTLSQVVARHRDAVSSSPAAARVLLAAARTDSAYLGLLPRVVAHADPETARRAIRHALAGRDEIVPEVAAAALARPELGGLALRAAMQAGMEPDAFCWDLLDDPELGADAARLLAADSKMLVDETRRRIASASSPARLRMLLALKLQASPQARELLAELAEAPWLSAQQRREVRAWL